jgi:hypothetical protein
MLRSTLLRVLAAAGTLILSAPLYLSHAGDLPAPAIEPASAPTAKMTPMSQFVMSPCEKKCDADYEADATVCGKVADQAERKRCNERAYARYKSCRGNCPQKDNDDRGDQGLKQCYEDCAFQHGRDIESCRRMKDPTKRSECYDRANQTHAKCRRDCEKKYKRRSS